MSATIDRRGFAIPLAILALALVTAAVAASAAANRAEIVANQSARAQDRAYQLAESGLELFVARHGESGFSCDHCLTDPSVSAVDSEWTRVTLVGGYADVVSTRLRARIDDANPALFFIRSRGVDTIAKLSGNSLSVFAERTVGQYATFRTATIKPIAAFVSITGLTKSGTNAGMSGDDVAGCGGTSIKGLAVPTGELSGLTSNIDGSGASPSIAYSSVDALKASLGIDWTAIKTNNAIPADYVDTWPGNVWAVTRRTDANFQPTSDGKGILIAENDVTFAGGRDFDGIMLIGGKLTTTGSSSAPSTGIVITGLNYLLPGAGNPVAGTSNNSSITNNKTFQYSSCSVSIAISLLNKYYAISNAWVDNVAVW